jgi:ABC-type multidrug transport system ATPase subunit
MNYVLEVNNLTKTFYSKGDPVPALKGISFSVEQGEIFGLLGPNGSGKSTTLNIVSNLLTPDTGSVTLLGKTNDNPTYGQSAGFVVGDSQFQWSSTGKDILEFYRSVFGASKQLLSELIERFDLSHRLQRKWPQYSNGEKTRIRLVRSLLASPTFLLLDEPTVGLDPSATRDFRDTMLALRNQGTTILLTSHYMADVEALADRVCFIHNGFIESVGTLASFQSAKEFVDIEFENSLAINPQRLIDLQVTQIDAHTLRVPISEVASVLTWGRAKRFTSQEESLEDYFVNLARRGQHSNGSHNKEHSGT